MAAVGRHAPRLMAAGPVHRPVFARLCPAMSYRMSPELIEHRRRCWRG